MNEEPYCVVCKKTFASVHRYKWLLWDKPDPTLLVFQHSDIEGVCQPCLKALIVLGFSEVLYSNIDTILQLDSTVKLHERSIELLKYRYLSGAI